MPKTLLTTVIASLCLFGLALGIRIYPLLKHTLGGIDAWYFLSYIRELKRTKRFPVKLPQYLMDIEEQWYPPGFPLLLALLPTSFLHEYHWLISPLIDCLQLLLLYVFTLTTTGSLLAAIIASAIYAVTYTLISENLNMNSRSLGATAEVALMLCIVQYIDQAQWWWLVTSLVMGAVVLLTHKMSTQCFVFTILFLTLIESGLTYITLAIGIVIFTLVVSGGFCYKVLLGHIDILLFWQRNLHNLGAHQILESPIYKGEVGVDTKAYKPGMTGLILNVRRVLSHNFFLIPLLIAPFVGYGVDRLYWWAISVYILAFVTTLFGPLRFLGEGYKYLKMAAFPTAYVLSRGGADGYHPILATFIGLAVLVNLSLIVRLYKILSAENRGETTTSQALSEAVQFIGRLPQGVVLCLPQTYPDYVVYHTNHKVLWGGHSGGFNLVEDFFPVLRKPIEYFIEKYHVSCILLDKDYVTPAVLGLDSNSSVKELRTIGNIILYERVSESE